MDAAQRDEILTRYREHAERFETLAARRPAVAEVIPMPAARSDVRAVPDCPRDRGAPTRLARAS